MKKLLLLLIPLLFISCDFNKENNETQQPSTAQPTTQQPATTQPATQQPATDQPATPPAEQPTTPPEETTTPVTDPTTPVTNPETPPEENNEYDYVVDYIINFNDIIQSELAKQLEGITNPKEQQKVLQKFGITKDLSFELDENVLFGFTKGSYNRTYGYLTLTIRPDKQGSSFYFEGLQKNIPYVVDIKYKINESAIYTLRGHYDDYEFDNRWLQCGGVIDVSSFFGFYKEPTTIKFIPTIEINSPNQTSVEMYIYEITVRHRVDK